jgi:hypothetical protein
MRAIRSNCGSLTSSTFANLTMAIAAGFRYLWDNALSIGSGGEQPSGVRGKVWWESSAVPQL